MSLPFCLDIFISFLIFQPLKIPSFTQIGITVLFRLLVVITFCLSYVSLLRAGDNPLTVRAVRVSQPPKVDGVLDDDVWKQAEPATGFIQRDPEEGKSASERSEIRVLYDDEGLYFGCMYFDSDPAKIVARLTRRDNQIESDNASIRIDSYHDHQTGLEFTFNAAGVKTDILQYDDANREDDSWDPVWEVQTRITDDGWCAEVKIPFRILRYRSGVPDSAANVWGINFLRYISRKQESERWAFTPKSQSGFISRYGHLTGLHDLPSPQQLEVLPFVTSKGRYEPATPVQRRKENLLGDAGLDLKYGITSNFTIDATINPDFGQVEADPAVLNLSTFETFYPEKRPFFIEGTQIIRFTTFGGEFGPGMFYSRRIGRAISTEEVRVPAGGLIDEVPEHATILGAAKFTGRTSSGLSIGALQAFTQKESAEVIDSLGSFSDQVVEPFASYSLVRFKQDVLDNSNVGTILTATTRRSRKPAFTNGYDWHLKFGQNTYQLDGFLALSQTTNRADERITGSAGKIQFSQVAAEHWLWSFGTDYTSPKYNINDVGFFFSPDDYGGVATLTYKEDAPAQVVRNYSVMAVAHVRENFEGVNLARQLHLNGNLLFSNYWRMTASGDVDYGLYDPRETRGNGLYRKPSSSQTSTYLFSDERNDIIVKFGQRFAWDSKLKRARATEVGVVVKPLPWMEWIVNVDYQHFRNQEAWWKNIGNDAIFADRNTEQSDITLRSTITFTRDLTLQLYGQVFLAKGHYENFRRLVGTSEFETTSADPSDADFNRHSFHSNIVLRWEYLPGSTMFLVWSQARYDQTGEFFTPFWNDVEDTFTIPPSNILLLKASYWLTL